MAGAADSARRRAPRRRVRRRLRAARAARLCVGIALLLAACGAVNWLYQVVRKPTELLFPVSARFNKTPAETWRVYGSVFRQHATRVMTPDLLAALAQTEAAGNPLARTYWRWSWTLRPFEIYRPASSSVGMYQMTNAAFDEAQRYCIRQHAVVQSCADAAPYWRLLPGDAVELTAAYLDRSVADILARQRRRAASLRHRQQLAALVHLCGSGVGERFAASGFRVAAGARCGAHDAPAYLARVAEFQAEFRRLAAAAP